MCVLINQINNVYLVKIYLVYVGKRIPEPILKKKPKPDYFIKESLEF